MTTPSKSQGVRDIWQTIGLGSLEPICAFDTDYRLIAFNQAHNDEFFRVNGFYTRIGDVFPDLFIPKQGQVMRRLMARALSGESFTVVAAFGKPELGTPEWEIAYAPLRDEAGHIFGAFHHAKDLTGNLARSTAWVRWVDVQRSVDDADLRRIVAQLDDQLRNLDDPERIAALCSRVVGETLQAGSAGFFTMGSVGDDGEAHHAASDLACDWQAPAAPGSTGCGGPHGLPAFGADLDLLRRGDDFVFADVEADTRTAPQAVAYLAAGVRAGVHVPVLEQGRVVASFVVCAATPRTWSPSELAFIRNVADRAWLHVERRRAEARLRDLMASLETQVDERTRERDRLWDTSVDLLAHIAYDGRLLRLSPSWRRVFGHSAEVLQGAGYLAFVHPDDVDAVTASLQRLRQTQQPSLHRHRLRCADDSWRTIEWSFAPEPGQPSFHAVGRDMTAELAAEAARHQLEEQLRQSQKMEAVGQLTGGLAHDFNNLLGSVGGSLQMLRLRIGQGRTENLERYVALGEGAVKRAAALTQRMLAFARRQTLDPRPADVNRLVRGIEELIRHSVGPGIEVEVVGAVGLWPIRIDTPQLENALLNLCLNARDAMPEGGRLTIETANKWFDERVASARDMPPGQYVALSVTDTGTGMTAAVKQRAFEPFFTTKPLGLGTGLGLSMVYGFAQQSGGQVRIYSELGLGTTLCLYFPRHQAEAGAAAAPRSPSDADAEVDSGETVLLVEDDEAIRAMTAEVLSEVGYRVLEAVDGKTALDVLQGTGRIDLLVTDVGLPGGLNGRQVADAARVGRPGLKVLFITGYAEHAAIGGDRLESGMALLTKPFELDALTARARSLLDRVE